MPDAKTIPVLVNRAGGAAASSANIERDVVRAFEKAGLNASVELIDGGQCEVRCKALAKKGAQTIVVGGGDGTISAAATALAGGKTTLAILPLGTLNHFARDLGVPLDLDEAAEVVANGKPRSVDLGEMNGRLFLNNSAIGLYPMMVVDRDSQRKRLGRSKRLAMLVASLRTLARFHHQRLSLTVNRRKAPLDTPLLFVGNNDYRTDISAAGARDSLEDGRLSVMVMRKKTRRGFLAAVIRALLDRSRDDDMVRLDDVTELKVTSRRGQLHVALDGEVERIAPPLRYRIRPKALRVITP